MSFRAVYEVVDAWQKVTRLRSETIAWRLLIWMARNTDDSTLTIIRSQARLAEELGTTDRTVRSGVASWERLGILRVIEHGGGRARKPARYRIDLANLTVYAMRCHERATAEAHALPELSGSITTRKSRTSGVGGPSSEVHRLPELDIDAPASGVESELRKFEGGLAPNSGSPELPGIQRSSSEKIISKERVSHGLTPSLGHPSARLPEGRLAGASDEAATEGDQSAIRMLLESGNGVADVARILKNRGLTVDQIQAVAGASR